MIPFDFSGKVAFVTGASSGLGFDMALQLYNLGCTIVVNSRSHTNLLSSFSGCLNPPPTLLPGDATDLRYLSHSIDFINKTFGRLDFLICNLGSGKSVPPGQETLTEWRKAFEINFWPTVSLVDLSVDLLAKHSGKIICISSICGVEVIPGAPVPYSVSKSALNSYVKSISFPLSKLGISINAIAPGNILFDGSTWDSKIKCNAKAVDEFLSANVPLNKLGSPSDISSFCMYLLSPMADFITGSVFTVDGGQTRSFQ